MNRIDISYIIISQGHMMYERFICPICKIEFQDPNMLREHRMKEHKGQSRKKPAC
ncbi:MAG: hypothetical protein QM398_07130 [Thermoproteota archaeon]|nr:hypothetical protein [Thermoproteota archaeon]